MLFRINGFIRPNDLEKIIGPLVGMLAEGGVNTISSVDLSFLAWSEKKKIQILDEDDNVTLLNVDAEVISSLSQAVHFRLPEGVRFGSQLGDFNY